MGTPKISNENIIKLNSLGFRCSMTLRLITLCENTTLFWSSGPDWGTGLLCLQQMRDASCLDLISLIGAIYSFSLSVSSLLETIWYRLKICFKEPNQPNNHKDNPTLPYLNFPTYTFTNTHSHFHFRGSLI